MWRAAGWRGDGVAGRPCSSECRADLDAQLVDRILQFQKSDMRLQSDDQFRAKFEQVFRTKSLPLAAIESLNVRPFQPNHVEREREILPANSGCSVSQLSSREPRFRKVNDCDGQSVK